MIGAPPARAGIAPAVTPQGAGVGACGFSPHLVVRRRGFDARAVPAEGSATLRLLFLAGHSLRSLARLAVARTENPRWLTLAAAEHSRLGSVADAVGSSGGTTSVLLPGDRLTLSFAGTAAPAGQARRLFLLARGGYAALPSSSSSASSTESEDGPEGSSPRFAFALEAPRPTPGPGATQIGYSLAHETRVSIRIFDVTGRLVRTLVEGMETAGRHEAWWDARDQAGLRVPAGLYLLLLKAGSFQGQRKLVLLP